MHDNVRGGRGMGQSERGRMDDAWGDVSKERFKEIFLAYGGGYGRPYNETAQEVWIEQYEPEVEWSYHAIEPETIDHDRMHVVRDFGAKQHRIFFMTDEAEERLYDFPE